MTSSDDIEQRAAEWIARREGDGPRDAQEEEAFQKWFSESTAHRVAYLRLEAAWRRADRLASLRAPMRPVRQPPTIPAYARLAAGAVFALSVAAFATWFLWRGPPQQSYATALGGHAVVELADGSHVELNTATAIRAAVGNRERAVWLDTGEAYFSVAHDGSRPFHIWIGQRAVTVVGTKFSVRRAGDLLDVLVEEGRVWVDDGAGKSALLGRGDEARVSTAAFERLRLSARDVAAALGWRLGLIVFDRTPLADAAAEFNRYNRTRLVVADPEAARLRVGGTFQSNNVAGFLRLLTAVFGLHETVRGDTVIISR